MMPGTMTLVFFVIREKFAGEKIPTLEEAVEECIKLQLTIYFDVKGHPDEVQPTERDSLMCSLYNLYTLCWFNWRVASQHCGDVSKGGGVHKGIIT